ncbi:MAG: formate/nitrite transporter family protein [Bacteroidales bacterium]|nr:formate/nitrite transporter family protein [Bacteroidales bacterium]
MDMWKTFRSAIVAGICIGIAGFGNLAVGGVVGAVIFAFGLSAVVCYKVRLYTGTAGFISGPSELGSLGMILLGNITGCLLVGLLTHASPLPINEAAQKILEGRLGAGPWRCGLLAIGCGFIMTTAVKFARQGQWLPLLFGVPLFIICGFPHSIADAFYYLAVPGAFLAANAGKVLLVYVMIVLGNFVGCNLTRFILWEKD